MTSTFADGIRVTECSSLGTKDTTESIHVVECSALDAGKMMKMEEWARHVAE